jgi:hypothetical protein
MDDNVDRNGELNGVGNKVRSKGVSTLTLIYPITHSRLKNAHFRDQEVRDSVLIIEERITALPSSVGGVFTINVRQDARYVGTTQ